MEAKTYRQRRLSRLKQVQVNGLGRYGQGRGPKHAL